MLGAESLEAAGTDAVGEAQPEPPPRCDPVPSRVPVVVRVPGTASDKHRGAKGARCVPYWSTALSTGFRGPCAAGVCQEANQIAATLCLRRLLRPDVAMAGLVVEPFIDVAHVDFGLAGSFVDQLLPLIQHLRPLGLEVLELTLEERRVGEDRGQPRLIGG